MGKLLREKIVGVKKKGFLRGGKKQGVFKEGGFLLKSGPFYISPFRRKPRVFLLVL